MSLRKWLLSQGVSSRDLSEAVKQARETTQTAAELAGVAEKVLLKLASKAPGNKTHALAVLGARGSRIVREAAEGMLKKR